MPVSPLFNSFPGITSLYMMSAKILAKNKRAVRKKNHNKLQPERERERENDYELQPERERESEREREREKDYDKENSMPFFLNRDNLLMKT